MKKLHYLNLFLAALFLGLVACDPQENDDYSLAPAPSNEQVMFDYAYNADNPNIVNFSTNVPGFRYIWDFGNGDSKTGKEVTAAYPIKGDYTVMLTVYTEGGRAMNSKTVTIEETNSLMLDVPVYNLLTGGADQLEGKAWVIDKNTGGHFGVGPAAGSTPEWYAAGPNEKEGGGMYDDLYTFMLDGFKFIQQTNGDIFVNGAHAGDFPGAEAAVGDYKAPYTASDNLNWSVVENEDGTFLSISNGGFIGYYTGVSDYQVMTLEENKLVLKYLDSKNAELAWYLTLIPEGYTPPVEEPEYKIEDIQDSFEGDGNINWFTAEIAEFTTAYDNPRTTANNPSAKVAKYVRGEGEANMWTNVQMLLPYKMDLRQRNKFRLKVYMPAYNDYVTESAPDWWPVYRKLTPQVALKLQDSSHPAPWETQAEVIQVVDQFDEWVTLEFDFSAWADRTDFDKVVLQIGGEGHYIGGTFFIDDVELLPAP